MNITISGSGDFKIVNGELVEVNGSKFTVKKDGNNFVVSKGAGNNINISGGSINIGRNSFRGSQINMDGLSISTKGKTLVVDGDIDSVIVNGNEYVLTKNKKESKNKLGKNEYISFPIDKSIESINVSGSGSLTIDGEKNSISFNNSLILTISGSGDISLLNYRGLPIVASVSGSGDISLNNIYGPSILATVVGSGDISCRSSSFNSVNKNVVGSGDISGI